MIFSVTPTIAIFGYSFDSPLNYNKGLSKGMNVPNKLVLLPVVLFICLLLNVKASNIYVSRDNGVNDSSCWTGGRNCSSINLALEALLNQNSSVSIYIEQGSYMLFNSTETNLINLQYGVEIAGLAEPNKVIIECQDFAGLSFIRVNNINISNLTLLGCGSVQISSSVDERNSNKIFLKYQVALYIYECEYLNVANIHVNSSNGTGLTIYNTKRQVYVVHSVFANNKPPGYQEKDKHSSYGGSGLQIEHTYCNLTSSSHNNCEDTGSRVSLNAIYIIEDTKFIDNVANEGNLTTYKTSNSKFNNVAFGKGGGFSIILKGTSSKNTFLFSNIELQSNRARFGGGFYIGFHDVSSNNKVSLTKLIVSSNINEGLQTDMWDKDGGGGGGKVIFTGSDSNPHNNSLVIENSNFFDNCGMTGGGLSLELKLVNCSKCNNCLSIQKSNFNNNLAFLGSAVYFSQAFLSWCGPTCFYSEIEQLTFNNNKQICEQILESFASLPCSGTLYSSNIPLHLKSSSYQNAPVSFRNNIGSALEVHASYVEISAGTTVEFINNTADYGGAIALYDCSYLLITNNTKYIFTNNSASVHGGAIYSDTCTSNDQPTTLSSKCFIQYFKSEVHPNNWNSTFIFQYNYLKLDGQHNTSSIYAVNAIPCWQGTSDIPLSNYNEELNKTFCWQNWTYEPLDCNANIDSAPAYMKSESQIINLSVRPGDLLNLPIEVYDGTGDKKNDVSLSVCIISGSASFSESNANRLCISTSNNQVHLFYHEKEHSSNNESINLVVKTKGPVSLQIGFKVFFEKCKWPFISGTSQCSLISDFFCCSSSNFCDSCNKQCFLSELVSNKSYVKGKFGHCISHGHLHTITGQCPLSYYDYTCTTYEDNNTMRCISNRAGPLCGACAANHSLPLNSINLECTDCSTNDWGWLYFLLFEIIPVTIMVSLILIFNLKVTNGSINGFIFYSQIITLSIPSWFYPAWMTNLWLKDKAIVGTPNIDVYKFSPSTFPFSIWNLNFLTVIPPTKLAVCITKSMGSLGAIAFWYVVAVYPLILLVLLYIWLVLYNESYRFVVKVTRPVHQRLARLWQMFRIEPSLTDSIAIIYIVCFSQLANTSFKLLHHTTAYNVENKANSRTVFFYDGSLLYFGWPHALAGLLAICVLVSMVILPMFCLLLYQFQFTQRFLNYFKLKREGLSALFDVYTGGFHNGSNKTNDCRYFAGLFLFLRVAIMLIYFTPYYDLTIIPFLQMTFTIVAAGTIMIIRPYSNNIHNLTNFLMLLLLALLSGLTFISLNKKTLVAVIFVMYIPLLFALGYFLIWSLIKVQLCLSLQRVRNHILTNTNLPSEDHHSYLQSGSVSHHFPDRILNPDDYDEMHVSDVPPCDDHSTMKSNAMPGSNSVALRITSSTTYGSINATTTDSD